MTLTISKIAGVDALTVLEARRGAFRETSEYPFLIGDTGDMADLQREARNSNQSFDDIIRGALDIDLQKWITERRNEEEEYDFSIEETLGTWPGEVAKKGTISMHCDVLTGQIKPEVFVGSALIKEPWHLPAVLRFGGWNDCPVSEVHCAIFRRWQSDFGAQIVGMCSDVVECVVNNPPLDRAAALELAWQQYWYCADIVDQGCGSVSNLAATLLNSPYWYFWWD